MSPDQGGGERLPPQSKEAERCVLGSMLRDNGVIGDVIQILRTENLYLDAHQKIFAGIITLYDKGHPVDLVMLAELLKEQKHIEDVGGYAYLAELWDAAPTAANAEYYARIVRDKAIVRHLIHASTEILRDAYDQAMPADDLLEGAERKILDIAEHGHHQPDLYPGPGPDGGLRPDRPPATARPDLDQRAVHRLCRPG